MTGLDDSIGLCQWVVKATCTFRVALTETPEAFDRRKRFGSLEAKTGTSEVGQSGPSAPLSPFGRGAATAGSTKLSLADRHPGMASAGECAPSPAWGSGPQGVQ